MLYLIALFLPFMAIYICNKPVQGTINFILWLLSFFFWPLFLIPIVHAFAVVATKNSDDRTDRLIKAMNAGREIKE